MSARGETNEHQRRQDRVLFAKLTTNASCITGMSDVRIGVGESVGSVEDVREIVAREAIAIPHRVQRTSEFVLATTRGGDQHVFGQK